MELMFLCGMSILDMESTTDYFKQQEFRSHITENGLDLSMDKVVGIN